MRYKDLDRRLNKIRRSRGNSFDIQVKLRNELDDFYKNNEKQLSNEEMADRMNKIKKNVFGIIIIPILITVVFAIATSYIINDLNSIYSQAMKISSLYESKSYLAKGVGFAIIGVLFMISVSMLGVFITIIARIFPFILEFRDNKYRQDEYEECILNKVLEQRFEKMKNTPKAVEIKLKTKNFIELKRSIRKYYKENKLLCNITIISIVIIISYEISLDWPELWKHADKHFEILSQLGLAIIASHIFGIIQIYIPNEKNRRRISPYIRKRIKKILNNMEEQFTQLTKIYLHEEINMSELNDDQILEIANKYRASDLSDIQEAYSCRNINLNEMMNHYFEEIDNEIENLLMGYSTYLNDNYNNILREILNSEFRKLFYNNPLFSLFDGTGIHGNAVLFTFKQHILNYNNLKKEYNEILN